MWTEWLRRLAFAGPAQETRELKARPKLVVVKEKKLEVAPEMVRPQLMRFLG
ncbi:MAG: hypothetical protein JST54_25025 [Deltaproteobacteria bacterium]|nr:hypothetical protein [Deltaproteobacteria bacterium]